MSDIGEWLVVILYVLVIVIGAVYLVTSVIGAVVESEAVITVEERIGAHGESGIYLIMTEEGETFTVADNAFKLKFDASDRYASIKPDVRYHVVCTGWRFQAFSWYRNIIEITSIV